MPERRVLVLHSSIELYGSDRMLLAVLATLPEDCHVEVWLPDDVPFVAEGLPAALTALGVEWSVQPVPVLRRRYLTPRGLLSLVPRLVRLRSALRQARPDVLYIATSAMLLAAPVAWLAGIRAMLLHVQEIWTGVEGRILAALAGPVRQAVCISRPVQEALPASLRRRSRVIENAVPDSSSPWVDRSTATGPLEFLVASRWNAWKGYETLLRAWSSGATPGRLTVLGGIPPLGESVDVRELIRDLELGDSVRVVGEVDSVHPYLDAADVMIVPSDRPEPFGLVAIEAFCRARPVIASDGGGLADIVDSSTGWRFPLRDAAALRTVLESVDRAAVTEKGRRAREVYEERYSPQRFAAEFGGVWTELLGAEAPAVRPADRAR
ncbi:glycosyltransferase family 4 protein [Naasia aerilata]|uniref:Glycosyl transferase n=1 Tax=Naasia aerilata TaxID=1162966 RepID=A0ABM8GCH4_9MICO|nr:glycosyltransferase family 4 protein [Naasia aerilata]BDZ45931.1 glycosyl transferase [Naasia aerilata]